MLFIPVYLLGLVGLIPFLMLVGDRPPTARAKGMAIVQKPQVYLKGCVADAS